MKTTDRFGGGGGGSFARFTDMVLRTFHGHLDKVETTHHGDFRIKRHYVMDFDIVFSPFMKIKPLNPLFYQPQFEVAIQGI